MTIPLRHNESVVDANILAHSLNTNHENQPSSLSLLSHLRESDMRIAIDDTGKKAPARETSNMFREYEDCASPGSVPLLVVEQLFLEGRVSFYRRPRREVWSLCKEICRRNNHDAIVLGVGAASPDHFIVSNDWDDFDSAARHKSRKQLGISIVDSNEIDFDDDTSREPVDNAELARPAPASDNPPDTD